MADAPDINSPVSTIDDAELAGWQSLGTSCGCQTVYHPWRLLRRETRYRCLEEIAVRFRCSKCGRRPTHVWLYWQGRQDIKEECVRVILDPASTKAQRSKSSSR